MSDAMRRKIEAQKQRVEDADLAPQMSKQQTAEHERTIASILRPRESVLQALRRLRGPAPPKTAARKQAKLTSEQVHHRFTMRCTSCIVTQAKHVATYDRLSYCAPVPSHLAHRSFAFRAEAHPHAINTCMLCARGYDPFMPGLGLSHRGLAWLYLRYHEASLRIHMLAHLQQPWSLPRYWQSTHQEGPVKGGLDSQTGQYVSCYYRPVAKEQFMHFNNSLTSMSQMFMDI